MGWIDDVVDDASCPGQQLVVARGLGPERRRLRTRHQHRTHPRLDQAAGVDAVQPYAARLGELDGGEPDVLALHGDLADAGAATPPAEPRDGEQAVDGCRRLAVPV